MSSGVLLSTLARQSLLLGAEFDVRYPNAWLVWEPGERVTPAPQAIPVTTVVPLVSKPRTPVQGDPLCFPLVLKAPGVPLRLGRAPESDLLVDDLTVSREHLDLWLDAGEWYITVPPRSTATTMVRRMSLQPGEKMRLVDGCTVECGGVTCTFHQRGRFLPRVTARAQQLRGPA